jgi:hypothetical protein
MPAIKKTSNDSLSSTASRFSSEGRVKDEKLIQTGKRQPWKDLIAGSGNESSYGTRDGPHKEDYDLQSDIRLLNELVPKSR